MSVNLSAIWAYEMEIIKQKRRQDADRKKKEIMNKEEQEQADKDFENFFKEPKDLSLNGMYDTYIAPKQNREVSDDEMSAAFDKLFNELKPDPKKTPPITHCITGSYTMPKITNPGNYFSASWSEKVTYSTPYHKPSITPKQVQCKTLNQLFDEMYPAPNTTPNPKIPTEMDKYHDHLEHVHYKLSDLDEKNLALKLSNSYLMENNIHLKKSIEAEKQAKQLLQDKLISERGKAAMSIETQNELQRLRQNLASSEANRKHAMDHVSNQSKMIDEARDVINTLREKLAAGAADSTYKASAEHLGKKTLELLSEVTSTKTEYYRLREITVRDKKEIQNLKTENDKYKLQVTRLLDQQVKYDCQQMGTPVPNCGNCLSCKLSQTQAMLNQTTENFDKVNKERDNLKQQLAISKITETTGFQKERETLITQIKNANTDNLTWQSNYDSIKKELSINSNKIKTMMIDIERYKEMVTILRCGLNDIDRNNMVYAKQITKSTLTKFDDFVKTTGPSNE